MSPDVLARYATTGSGTVQGKKDPQKEREISYWEAFEAHGISDEAVRQSVYRPAGAFARVWTPPSPHPHYIDGDAPLGGGYCVVCLRPSTEAGGLPAEPELHPSLGEWYSRLAHLPQIARELVLPRDLDDLINARQSPQRSESSEPRGDLQFLTTHGLRASGAGQWIATRGRSRLDDLSRYVVTHEGR